MKRLGKDIHDPRLMKKDEKGYLMFSAIIHFCNIQLVCYEK